MASGLCQLEKAIDEVLKSGDVQALDEFLQSNKNEGSPMKCSQQFFTKLDKLVSRGLDHNNLKSASLGLAILHTCQKNLKLPGGCQGLSGKTTQVLLKKWFEKCRQLWIQCGPRWDETLYNLSEDFFEALMAIHDECKEGTLEITESFLYPVGQLAVDPRIYILIQKEAIHKFNLILDNIPVELKREGKILMSQEASDIMMKLAGQILKGGDYDLQAALMEALCRMSTAEQRKELAGRWFSMENVASAFVTIRNTEFETDCRRFLNWLNGMQGDKRRVYSYPCLEVYLDKHELLMPDYEKLEEFWIDFNLDSHSISFYFSSCDEDAQEGLWDTICIAENEVQSYTVTEKGKEKILQLNLSQLVVVGAVEGARLTIHFSSSLDIRQVARTVYGHSKDKGFVGKMGTSVVKTTVKITVEDNISQVVPESQMCVSESEKNAASQLLPAQPAPVQMTTPTTMRVSESATFISDAGGSVREANSLSAVTSSNTSVKRKGKPSLEMVRSCDGQGELYLGELRTTAKTSNTGTTPSSTIAGGMTEQNKPVEKAVDLVLTDQGEEQPLEPSFVPDTQPRSEGNISFKWHNPSASEIPMQTPRKTKSLSRSESRSSLAQQPEHLPSAQRSSVSGSAQRLQQVPRELPSASRSREDSTSSMQQAQRDGPAKGTSKHQISVEADVAPAKASTTKALQKRAPPTAKGETDKALSRKEKRDAEVAGSMVKLISSRYEIDSQSTVKDTADILPKSWIPPPVNRTVFNMSWLSTAKRDASGAVSLLKTTTGSTKWRKDIFAFNTDTPWSIGGKNKTVTNTSAISSSSIHDSSALLSTTKKGQPVAKEKRHVKKHLFSDTDYSTTDVSWLKESSRKPKPKIVKYPRQAPGKPKAVSPHTSYESPDFPPLSEKPVKGNPKPNKKKPEVKERVERPKKTAPSAAPNRPQAAGRRPQRTAAISTKRYKDLDTDNSQSESEMPPDPKKKPKVKERVEQPKKTAPSAAAPNRPQAAGRRPQRTAAISTKRYKDLDTDNSQSESETPPDPKKHFAGQQGKREETCLEVPKVKKRKSTSSELSTDTSRRLDRNKPSGLKVGTLPSVKKVLTETSKSNKKNAQERMKGLKGSRAARQTSPPFIEAMRTSKRSTQSLDLTCSPILTPRGSPLPASPDPPCEDTPSPVLLLPKPRSAASSKGHFRPSAFYSTGKKHGSCKAQSVRSVASLPSLTHAPGAPSGPSAAEISPVQECLPSATQSPLSLSTQPLLTSTVLQPSMPSPPESPFLEDTVNYVRSYGYSKVSSPSSVSLSQASTKDSPTAALAVSLKTEKTPSSEQDQKSEELDISGPSRKRQISLSSDSEEDEKEERNKIQMNGQCRMKPRKLFTSFDEGDVSRVMSSSHTMSSIHWEAEEEDGDMDEDEDFNLPNTAVSPRNLCQQFSSELKLKFKKRHNITEVFHKQSVKTVQQQLSTINTQVTKYRTQKLEQVQKVLLEAIHQLEQDDTALKSMEKDLATSWKKQAVAFRSFGERETMRNEALKKAFQSHSLEYEERIFTSQMCLMRNDMKSVQDRLLSEMQEEELQSVKRGLHSLFFP